MGTVISVAVPGQIIGIRTLITGIPTTEPQGLLYLRTSDSAGTLLAQKPFVDLEEGWNTVLFDDPIDADPEELYVAAWGPTNHYNSYSHFFDESGPGASGLVNGNLTAPPNADGVSNGKFKSGGIIAYPPDEFNASCYFVDFLFLPDEE